jgi:acyl-CoA synthetase (AMP-forming)/AMP-acid ligase II
MSELLCDLPMRAAAPRRRPAIVHRGDALDYATLVERIDAFAAAMVSLGLGPHERVGVYLDKRLETVVALFGASRAGGVFVPMNPLLKPEQVAYIARDCNVRVLVTGADGPRAVPRPAHVVVVGDSDAVAPARATLHPLVRARRGRRRSPPPDDRRRHGGDPLHLGQHRLAQGRGAVAPQHGGGRAQRGELPGQPADDRLLAVLPLSFDYGLSQLTTGFLGRRLVGAAQPPAAGDVVKALARERITGLAAVPPLWIQLAALRVARVDRRAPALLHQFGGAMPTATLAAPARRVPRAKPYLMYGLTEAFRSTYLPPDEVDLRPTRWGKAIPERRDPGVREDGSECAPSRAGRAGPPRRAGVAGLLERRRQDGRAVQASAGSARASWCMPEMAVWSGDTVRVTRTGTCTSSAAATR